MDLLDGGILVFFYFFFAIGADPFFIKRKAKEVQTRRRKRVKASGLNPNKRDLNYWVQNQRLQNSKMLRPKRQEYQQRSEPRLSPYRAFTEDRIHNSAGHGQRTPEHPGIALLP